MNSIDDFAVLDKCSEEVHVEEAMVTMKELKQSMDLLRIHLSDEQLHACLAGLDAKNYHPMHLLYRILPMITPKKKEDNYHNSYDDLPISKASNNYQYLDCFETELVPCTEGCGRKFRAEIVGKHAKICKSVFEKKVLEPAKLKENVDSENVKVSKGIDKVSKFSYKVPSSLNKEGALRAHIEHKRNAQIEQENKPGKLFTCTEGCGRKFFAKAFETHVKICKKVFQSKRYEYDAAAKRKSEDQVLFETIPYKKIVKEEKKEDLEPKGEPKWKAQSNAFREMVQMLRKEQAVGKGHQAESKEKTDKPASKWKAQSQGLREMISKYRAENNKDQEAMKTVYCTECGHKNLIVLRSKDD